ncbi:MAG TPA: carboxypeptidase-like regulatory domain-containing protein [Planctomycetota bacterium]|nr:carboxypeptidase-like regulatory domain-containing protein [Planctomycetota bacterium]
MTDEWSRPVLAAQVWALPLGDCTPYWVRRAPPLAAIASGVVADPQTTLGAALHGTTDAAGHVRLVRAVAADAQPPTCWVVVAEADGTWFRPVFVRPEDIQRRMPSEIHLGSAATVVGRVVDEDGLPTAGAYVRMQAWDELAAAMACVPFGMLPAQGISDEHGQFSLRGVPVFASRVEIAAVGHPLTVIDLHQPNGLLQAGSVLDVGTVALASGEMLLGRVTDAAGQPVPGALVVSNPKAVRSMGICPEYSLVDVFDAGVSHACIQDWPDSIFTRTDPQGGFALKGLVPHPAWRDRQPLGDRLDVVVLAPGFDPAFSLDVEAWRAPVAAELHVVLEPEAALFVHVVDDDTGAPLPDARVWADRALWPGGPETTKLRPDPAVQVPGSFLLRAAGRLESVVRVSAPGHGEVCAVVPGVGAGEVRELEVRLAREAVLEVHVVDGDGKPLRGVRLECGETRPLRWRSSTGTAIETDEAGVGRIERLAPGEHFLTVASDSDRARWESSGIVLVTGETRRMEVSLPRAASLELQLVDAAGRPTESAYVTLVPQVDGASYRPSSNADRKGALHFVALRPGPWDIVPDRGRTLRVELAEGEHRVLSLPLEEQPVLSGVVLHEGRKISDLFVQAWRVDEDDGRHASFTESISVDSLGRFTVPLPSPGRWRACATSMQFTGAPGTISNSCWSDVVQLDWAGSAEVVVTIPAQDWDLLVEDECGRIRPETEIRIFDGDKRRRATVTTDLSGHALLEGLAPGRYRAQLSDTSRGFGEPVDLVLEPAGHRSATTPSAHLVLPRGARVFGRVIDGDPRGGQVRAMAVRSVSTASDSADDRRAWVVDGHFDLSGLRAGTYRLLLEQAFQTGGGGFRLAFLTRAERLVTLDANQELQLDLQP